MFSLGQRIKELRMKKGFTQIDLAKGLCTPSMISQIESDRARPSYKILGTISDRLGVSLENLLSDVDLSLEYISTFKMSKAMVSAGEYTVAIPLLVELLATPRGSLATVDIQLLLAECYVQTQDFEQAYTLFQELYETAVIRQDHFLLATSLLYLGEISLHRNQFQLACYRFQTAFEEASRLNGTDNLLKARILNQLGIVHSKMGLLRDALTFFEQAIHFHEETDNPRELGLLYLRLGESHKQLGHFDKSVEYAERAYATLEGLHSRNAKAQIQVVSASVYAEQGRTPEGIALLESAIVTFQELGDKTSEGCALVELAKIQVHTQQYKQAETSCQKARTLLPELHPQQGWIYKIRGHIARQQQNNQEASRRLRQAASVFKQSDQWDAWTRTLREMAELHEEYGEYDKAYEVMREIHIQGQQLLSERGIVI